MAYDDQPPFVLKILYTNFFRLSRDGGAVDLKIIINARAKGQHRQPSDQVRRYLEIAIIAEENPDLPFSFIEGILEARAELDAGLAEPYEFGEGGR